MNDITIIFKPQDKKVAVARGTDLLTAAFKCGIALNSSCGGEGLCGKCKVVVKRGDVKKEPSSHIDEKEMKRGVVLACQTRIESDLEVMVPRESLGAPIKIEGKEKGSEEFTKGIISKRETAFKHAPLVSKAYLELPEPTLDDNVSDLDRIYRELKEKFEDIFITTRLASTRHLGDLLRESDFKITAVLGYRDCALEILAVEPGDTEKRNYGLAFDIGTTTVTGQLIDLGSNEILGTRIAFNRQAQFGSDIITRIVYASKPDGLKALNEAVVSNINEIIEDLVESSSIGFTDIYSSVFAGNTTMMHLLLKIDPSHIRKEPYVATTSTFPFVSQSEIGLKMNPKGVVHCLPAVSAYIGGDTVSGVLACGLFEDQDLSLLVDIGTNGEIVLGNNEWMMACAASAGPAFEGSGVTSGMKAVKGAIQKVNITESLEAVSETIGGEPPKGICGSGYIDLLKWMLKRRIIGKDGKIDKTVKSKRIRKGKAGYEFIVTFKKDAATKNDIVISEEDIDNLKRAKGAIFSGMITLLNKVGKALGDLKRIYIAGGFGNYLDIESAITIGLLPDIERSIYEFIGNSSLAGARLALSSREAYLKTEDIGKSITYLDLSSEPKYMDEYVASLFFPHTDLGRFPSALR